jgi:hypothetical protein
MFAAIEKLCLQFCGKRCLLCKKYENFIKFISKYNLTLCMGMEMSKEKQQQTLLTGLFKTIKRAQKEHAL